MEWFRAKLIKYCILWSVSLMGLANISNAATLEEKREALGLLNILSKEDPQNRVLKVLIQTLEKSINPSIVINKNKLNAKDLKKAANLQKQFASMGDEVAEILLPLLNQQIEEINNFTKNAKGFQGRKNLPALKKTAEKGKWDKGFSLPSRGTRFSKKSRTVARATRTRRQEYSIVAKTSQFSAGNLRNSAMRFRSTKSKGRQVSSSSLMDDSSDHASRPCRTRATPAILTSMQEQNASENSSIAVSLARLFDTENTADSSESALENLDLSQELGFKNLGQTCYFNSTLNLLVADDEIRGLTEKELIRRPGETQQSYDAREKFRKRLHHVLQLAQVDPKLIRANWDNARDNYYAGPLADLNAMNSDPQLGSLAKFELGIQHDAEEYRKVVFSILGYDQVITGFRQGDLITKKGRRSTRTRYDDASYEKDKENPKFLEKYGHSLEISPVGVHKVSQAIQSYFAPSETDSDFIFAAGEARGSVTKKIIPIVSQNPPLHLFVDIKRRSGVTEMDSIPLSIDQFQLEFTKESSLGQNLARQTVRAKYSPRAVVVHTGSALSGHYYEYRYDAKTNTWTEHNDTRVTVLRGRKEIQAAVAIMRSSATSILYKRLDEE